MLNLYGADGGHLKEIPYKEDGIIPAGVIWFDMIIPTAEEEKAVENYLQINIPTREELEEIEASSRLYQDDGAAFMTANVVRRTEDERPESSPVTFIIKGNQLITIRYSYPQAFPSFISRAIKNHNPVINSWTVLISLVEIVVDRVADHLERVGGIIDTTMRQVFTTSRTESGKKIRHHRKKPLDFSVLLEDVGEEGNVNSIMRESLMSLNRMAMYMQALIEQAKIANEAAADSKDYRSRIRTIQRDINSLIDYSSFLTSKISFLLDAVLGMSAIEQNRIIKIFSVASVVFLPPTLVASIYGMNFQFMPELNWHYGYPMAIFIMILSALLPYLFFRRKGWL